jgi:hypothetical protein
MLNSGYFDYPNERVTERLKVASMGDQRKEMLVTLGIVSPSQITHQLKLVCQQKKHIYFTLPTLRICTNS